MKSLFIVGKYVGIMAAVCYALAGCSDENLRGIGVVSHWRSKAPAYAEVESSSKDSPNQQKVAIVAPVDYGNGVLYFDATQASFAAFLSKYKKDHPCSAVEAMTGNGDGPYGHDRGYFVSVHQDPNCPLGSK